MRRLLALCQVLNDLSNERKASLERASAKEKEARCELQACSSVSCRRSVFSRSVVIFVAELQLATYDRMPRRSSSCRRP